MKKLIAIKILLLSFYFANAQNLKKPIENNQDLKLFDLMAASIMSIDQIDSTLRLKGYKLSSIPTNEQNHFQFLKNSTVGQLDMITVFSDEETANYVICSISDNEKLFYSIKNRCEDRSWHPVRKEEKISEGSFTRSYCDGEWKYKFTITNDVKFGMLYTIYVIRDSRCF